MWKKLAFAAAASMVAASVHAVTADRDVKETVALNDGSSVVIFKDGQMAMENRFGRPFMMPEGERMEAKDGRTIVMSGNAVSRLWAIQAERYGP